MRPPLPVLDYMTALARRRLLAVGHMPCARNPLAHICLYSRTPLTPFTGLFSRSGPLIPHLLILLQLDSGQQLCHPQRGRVVRHQPYMQTRSVHVITELLQCGLCILFLF